jgi:tetratricopeptide (TPR) repeat protein
LDRLNAESWESLAETEYFMGQLDEAAADAKKALELSPDVWPGDIVLRKLYVMQARPADALSEIELIRYDSQRDVPAGQSAAGSPREWHSRGHGFDPHQLHQLRQRLSETLVRRAGGFVYFLSISGEEPRDTGETILEHGP